MRVALTGSRGFIGSHVKTHLESLGCTVDEWDLKIDKPINQIILHKDTEYVIHLAAFADVRESIREPQKYWDNNVTPTTAIQEYCHKLDIPLLYASSSCIHQWHLSPYGMSKKINEETAYENQVGLRFTTVYGEGARDEMLIGRLLDGRVSYLTDHIRDFIHVSDVVMAISLLMRHDLTELKPAYDIGTGKGVIVSDLGVLAGFDIDIKPGDRCEAYCNTANINDMLDLGFEALIDIEEYIKENRK